MPDTPERLGRLEVRMDRVEQGVANFREFQTEAREFFARSDERAETERKHAREIKESLEEANQARNIADERRYRRLTFALGILGLIFTAYMAILGYREYTRKMSLQLANPAVQSQQKKEPPQDAARPWMPPQ